MAADLPRPISNSFGITIQKFHHNQIEGVSKARSMLEVTIVLYLCTVCYIVRKNPVESLRYSSIHQCHHEVVQDSTGSALFHRFPPCSMACCLPQTFLLLTHWPDHRSTHQWPYIPSYLCSSAGPAVLHFSKQDTALALPF